MIIAGISSQALAFKDKPASRSIPNDNILQLVTQPSFVNLADHLFPASDFSRCDFQKLLVPYTPIHQAIEVDIFKYLSSQIQGICCKECNPSGSCSQPFL